MATFRDPAALARAQRERARRLKHGYTSIDAASQAAAAIAQGKAIELTSGTVSARELARAGHPFARKGSRKRAKAGRLLPALPINAQRGRVRRGWRVFQGRAGHFVLQNIEPAARYVLAPGGTKTMVDRRFWRELNRQTLPEIRAKRLSLWRAALKG